MLLKVFAFFYSSLFLINVSYSQIDEDTIWLGSERELSGFENTNRLISLSTNLLIFSKDYLGVRSILPICIDQGNNIVFGKEFNLDEHYGYISRISDNSFMIGDKSYEVTSNNTIQSQVDHNQNWSLSLSGYSVDLLHVISEDSALIFFGKKMALATKSGVNEFIWKEPLDVDKLAIISSRKLIKCSSGRTDLPNEPGTYFQSLCSVLTLSFTDFTVNQIISSEFRADEGEDFSKIKSVKTIDEKKFIVFYTGWEESRGGVGHFIVGNISENSIQFEDEVLFAEKSQETITNVSVDRMGDSNYILAYNRGWHIKPGLTRVVSISENGETTMSAPIVYTEAGLEGGHRTIGLSAERFVLLYGADPRIIDLEYYVYDKTVLRLGSLTEFIEESQLSIDEQPKIYPNPSSQALCIEYGNVKPIATKILDFSGKTHLKTILFANDPCLDLSTLKRGIYLIEMTGTDFTSTQKIIIQH